MATYYRWRKRSAEWELFQDSPSIIKYMSGEKSIVVSSSQAQPTIDADGTLSFSDPVLINLNDGSQSYQLQKGSWMAHSGRISYPWTNIYYAEEANTIYLSSLSLGGVQASPGVFRYGTKLNIQNDASYVYSVNSSAYPNGEMSGNYYYDQRTTITSPVAPTGLTYPSPITTSSATVSWTASVTNVPIYAVSTYEVSYSTNGGSTWTVAGTTADTSLSVTLPTEATSIQFRVRAQDSNGQWSSYATGTASTVLLAPTLTVPSMAMQGQQITVNWTAIDGATSYTLQRQANTDDGWVQVYSGNALTFTETVGTWTTVQYQVQAVFSSGAGGWATSGSIPVVSASALVISGQDEDLGLITHDVPYTVSTDTGNPISLTRTVNGVQVASLTVENGFAYDIPVMDLPTGEGTIVISASVNTSSGAPVTATRTWTYTKTEFSFPNVGSTAQLTLQGENVFPATLAECVRVGANLGGDLGHALEMIAPSILNGAKIETGSYTGTGTYGESNPNSLTFSFKPKALFVCANGPITPNYAMSMGLWLNNTQIGISVKNDGGQSEQVSLTWSENSVSWYSSDEYSPNSTYQLNYLDVTYFYVAIG